MLCLRTLFASREINIRTNQANIALQQKPAKIKLVPQVLCLRRPVYKPDLASMLVQEAPEVVDLVGRAPRRKRRTNNGAVDAQKIRRIIRKRGKRLKTARAGATTTRHREEDGEQSLLDEEEEEEDDQEERRSASRAS